MTNRHEYALDVSDFDPSDLRMNAASPEIRKAQITYSQALAELMIEAYRGTIDYDDETVEDAIREIQTYLAGGRGGRPLLDESRLAFVGPRLVGACLTGWWDERQLPIIAYVMTHGEWKNRGIGKQLLSSVLLALRQQGYQEVRAVITAGNFPSEQLFLRSGFQKVNI